MTIGLKRLRIALASLVLAHIATAGTVVLKNAFIEKYKNRATIEVTFEVDHAHARPNKIDSDGKDGDLHTSGRSAEVGLPMVVEVVNAASQKPVLDLIHKAEPANGKLPITGALRFWFEHPSTADQVQGQAVPKPKDTNPAHCFEIHPITKVKDASALGSFVPIPKFQAYDAKTAFDYYESLKVTVKANKTATSITAKKAQYNYAEFVIELKSAAKQVEDGYLALATVFDEEGTPVVEKLRRMVFVKGTAPADRVRNAKPGDQFHVLGIPRVNLERIAFITNSKAGAEVTTQLPYEMIIVAVLPD